MAAAGHGNLSIIHELLSKGSKLNLVSKNLWTALDFAQNQNQPEAFAYLSKIQSLNPIEEKKEILEDYQKSHNDENIDFFLLKSTILHLHQKSEMQDAFLVFLPGYEEIIYTKDLLKNRQDLKICMLHSQLNSKEQKQAFLPR